MTAFVILAAGKGTRIGRVGESLHKSLVPLDRKAIISHLFDLAPEDARIIVLLGHRGSQIRDYVRLAHPGEDITLVDVPGWDDPAVAKGPGGALLAARPHVGDDDLIFTSCDTLWAPAEELWESSGSSWTAVAPAPVGTPPERWCRVQTTTTGRVTGLLDKTAAEPEVTTVYTGLSYIRAEDLLRFWSGVESGGRIGSERQVTGGLDTLAVRGQLETRPIEWTDVGDAAAYQRAVIERSGYDWTKEREATWVLPDAGRVVKFWADPTQASTHLDRAQFVGEGLPKILDSATDMLAYEYATGDTAYNAITDVTDVAETIAWANNTVWRPVTVPEAEAQAAAVAFYHDKTLARIDMLQPHLQPLARGLVARIDWDDLVTNVKPCRWHGDFNFGNIVIDVTAGQVHGIDWRGDFAGRLWGDKRYDLAKLLVGCRVHWERAARGDFTPWREGHVYEEEIRKREFIGPDVDAIAALTLLNSAPLHASPLDEVLVVRAAAWLEGRG